MSDEKVFNEFRNKRKDVSELRAALNSVNEKKEACYSEKEKAEIRLRNSFLR